MSEVSAVQAAANQANAQLSHGAVTPEGKRRSAYNALRHGLTGRVVVLPSEDLKQYEAFSEKLRADLDPKGELEIQIAQTIVDTQWRLNRARSLEDGMLSLGQACLSGHPELAAALAAAQAFKENAQAFNLLSVYEARLHRMLEKSLDRLEKLQTVRFEEESIALHQALRMFKAAQKEGKPFNPKELGFDFSEEFLAAENARRSRLDAVLGNRLIDSRPAAEQAREWRGLF